MKTRTDPTYQSWNSMRQRCNNRKNSHYSYYGGRGIKVCDYWDKFEHFLEDMGERPQGLTLDRINPNGHYVPSNCRWATRKEQMATKRQRGMKLTLAQVEAIRTDNRLYKEIALDYGINLSSVSHIKTQTTWKD